MRTQIYTMQTIDEAQAVVALGVDQIGITPSNLGLPGEVDFATARAIVEAVGNTAVTVALSVESNLDAIETMVQAVCPDILHLCGLENTLLPDAVRTLRERLPNLPIMQAISVAGPEALDVALRIRMWLIISFWTPKHRILRVSGRLAKPTIGILAASLSDRHGFLLSWQGGCHRRT